jgi:hypothetical protein
MATKTAIHIGMTTSANSSRPFWALLFGMDNRPAGINTPYSSIGTVRNRCYVQGPALQAWIRTRGMRRYDSRMNFRTAAGADSRVHEIQQAIKRTVSTLPILLAIETVVRLQGSGVTGGAKNSTAYAVQIFLYLLLIAIGIYWATLSHWLYFWDEPVRIGGFAAIELTVSEWRHGLLGEQEQYDQRSARMIDGRCECGRIQFEVDGEIEDFGHCHCSQCRRLHGAAYATFAGVSRDKFRYVSGETDTKIYASSESKDCVFCAESGSSIPVDPRQERDALNLSMSANDGDPPRPHGYHAYVGR